MSTCPNGHESATDDWCEVCGMRMTSPAAASAPPASSYPPPPPPPPYSGGYDPGYDPGYHPGSGAGAGYDPGRGHGGRAYDPDATAAVEPCPHCGTPREGYAQFCEECRYNFVTHAGTTFVPQSPAGGTTGAPPFPAAQPGMPPYQRYESSLTRPSQVNRPAEPLEPQSVTAGSGDFLLTPPAAYEPEAPPAGPGTWTAVIGADREYFTAMMARSGPEAQGLYFPSYSPEQRLPLTGPQITIGRRRHSTGEAPDIDLARAPEDPGVSHKHAVLVQQPDGGWSVVDQDSTNGTTVNGGEDSIKPFVPVPLGDGDRVHVGAWTTITIVRD